MVRELKPEPLWAKYITEENLPTEDLQRIYEIIGLEATKKLMFNATGEKFSIHAHCNQAYKRQYINDNYIDYASYNRLARECDTTDRYIYKVIKEYVKGKNNE